MRLNLDFETKSLVDLKKSGQHVYAAHPSTDFLCASYAFDEEQEPRIWYPGEPIPEEIADRVADLDEIRAWNAKFERLIWRYVWERYGMPVPELEQYVCTMAEATAQALPRALGKSASVLNVAVQKDAEGRKLMLRFSKPDKKGKFRVPTEKELHRIGDYCATDVKAEREVARFLQRLPPTERETYLLDQTINDRGIRLDVPLMEAAQGIVDVVKMKGDERIAEITGETATAVTQVDRIKEWVAEQGVEIPDLTKQTVIDLLKTELPEDVEEVLTIRQDNGRTSIGKLAAMAKGLWEDARLRGLLIYHAASTGRWAGVRVQPQNFPRPLFDARPYIPAVLDGDFDLIALDHPPIEVISYMLRNMLIASEGHRLMAGDFAQIEARVIHWLAGEKWQDHPYERMAGLIYGVDWKTIEKDSVERSIAKNVVLGAGFQMGWKKFIDYVYKATGMTLSEEDSKAAIDAFRDSKPRIVQLWRDLNRAAMNAIASPGQVQTVGVGTQIRYVVRGQFLWALLPSGRRLAYALPRTINKERPWGEVAPTATFMGTNTYTRRWQRNHIYGGLLAENVVQALARDIMVGAMKNVETADYPVVLTVHDEVVADVPEDHGTLEEFLNLMTDTPDWAKTCPVEVEGWEGQRWRK
jgi:DNA polymerase